MSEMDYKEIGRLIQIEQDKAHIATSLIDDYKLDLPTEVSRIQGIALFNDVAEENGLDRLPDPLGYMKLDNNVYDRLHDEYRDQYQLAADMADDGVRRGGSYGMKAVLNKINPTIRKDMKPYLPDDMKYTDLRFIETSPEMEKPIKDFVKERVALTYAWGIRRSVDESTMERIETNMDKAGKQLNQSLNVAIGAEEAPQKQTLSKQTLLENSRNNKRGLDAFMEQLAEPSDVTKANGADHAKASFVTGDKVVARFLLDNKPYLADFGFDMKKSGRELTTTWQSDMVDKIYNERNTALDLSGLEDESLSL